MKKLLRSLILAAMIMALACSAALAESISLDGTVTAAYTHEIYALNTAQVESVPVIVGQPVKAGDTIATLRTTKVYAEEDGTVAAVFGKPGDLTDTLTERYGAAIYLESNVTYTIAASTQYAYDSVETKLVHVGETVALRSRTDSARTGEGVIIAVNGASYSVHVTSGDFLIGESVSIYRGSEYKDTQRIGRGSIARSADVAVTGSGRIVSVAVQPGDTVKRGDLLMETLIGTGESALIVSDVDGVVARLGVAQGVALEENGVAAVIWPDDAMQIEIQVNENDLTFVHEGDTVNLLFDWEVERNSVQTGTVKSISAISDAASDDTVYVATIAFTPDETIRYGMSVTVTTLDSARTVDAEGSDAE
ncbi:MAG: HlyD family efflux transporter periplasmic adaptor subunit [Christensenellaceae bacterium]|nr:HlyD family efflux transporter periplasmic adaptor subunit [Christensenellaceae bacterium]